MYRRYRPSCKGFGVVQSFLYGGLGIYSSKLNSYIQRKEDSFRSNVVFVEANASWGETSLMAVIDKSHIP